MPWIPGIWNQLGTGSCVGHGVLGAVLTRLALLGLLGEDRSPLGVYDLARCLERAALTPQGRQLPELTDDGAYPSLAWQAIQRWGVPLLSERPLVEAEVNREPTIGGFEQGQLWRVDGAYRVEDGDTLAIRRALASGFPVQVASMVDDAFMDWTPDQNPIGPPDPRHELGGHAIYAVSYLSPTGPYRIVNSWGLDWGDDGTCLVSEEWLRQAEDCYVAEVTVGP